MPQDKDDKREETGTPEAEAAEEASEQGAGPSPAGEPDAEAAPDGATTDAERRVAELEAEVAELKDQLLRALAETENVRRRAKRDVEDASKYAITGFARELLSVADNLERALASVPEGARQNDEALDNLFTGVEMTQRQLQDAFDKVGIKPIEALGKKFDHNLHQAMFEVENPSVPAGTVVEEMQSGYVIADRLLRAAMVGVAKGGPKEAAPQEGGGDEGEGSAEEGETPQGGGTAAGAYGRTAGGEAAGGKVDTRT
jgi:molecular chaperone GrpE